MTQEALKLALEALKKCHYYMIDAGLPNQSLLNEAFTAYKALEAFKEHSMQEVQRLGQEIEHEPVGDEWTPCIKLPVIVHVRKQRHGETHVSTREGITPVNLEDLIMRGVSGEEYPIGRAIFEQTYSLDTTPPQRKPLTDEQIDALALVTWWTTK
jgi:hypothetical protein